MGTQETAAVQALKKMFKDGSRPQAIQKCEDLHRQDPGNREVQRLCATMHLVEGNFARAGELLKAVRGSGASDADVLFNIGFCERQAGNFAGADQWFGLYATEHPRDPEGWASRAECKFQLGEFAPGLEMADRAIALDRACLPAWTVRGHCQAALGELDSALASYKAADAIQPAGETAYQAGMVLMRLNKPAEAVECFGRAISLAPEFAKARAARADVRQGLGHLQEAAADYEAAVKLAPGDGESLKKATLCLLELGRGDEALRLCEEVLNALPDNLTARLGAEWVRSQLVPLWHVPMMNEPERNQAYFDGLQAVVAPDRLVFEIGTGSGLLAMMAAKLGARRVVTCEAVSLVARTASKIVERNGYREQVRVVAKPSHAVQLGEDLPEQADVLVHEIFSSELLGEHVLPAIEDAKRRLLKPGGVVMPGAASIMVALVGGDELAQNIHASESFGFDVREFNAIYPKKRPLYREDLRPVLMSEPVEAFRFDFNADSDFPAESRRLELTATQAGRCYGVIQWIRLDMAPGVCFENAPAGRRAVASWQQTTYGFDEPLDITPGKVVPVRALHDRARPWFALDAAEAGR